VALVAPAASPAWGLVISEINYNPPAGDDSLEFIEVSNDSATPEDISGYSFSNGISYSFPPGTVLGPYGIIVVCASAQAVKSRYGIDNAVGDFTGKLESSGERITLVNHAGIVVSTLRYSDRGKWPAAPDGTGHTLVLTNLHLDPKEPESWTQSPELGGSPGKPNFPAGGDAQFEDQVLIDKGQTWSYARGTQAFSTPETAWRSPEFNDAAWLTGPSGFGYGDGDDATALDDMLNTYTSVAIRKRFQAPGIQGAGELYLAINYDDGFIAYLNGQEIARASCGSPGEEFPFNAVATLSREAGVEELFPVPLGSLVPGDNVLAIAGYNFSAGSSDFSLAPRLILRRPLELQTILFNELYRGAQAGQGWVELYNSGLAPVDLSGHSLTDDPDRADPYLVPQGTVIDPGGFLVFDESAISLVLSAPEVHLFLRDPGGRVAAAAVFDRVGPPGIAAGDFSEGRFPDGGPLEWVTRTPTRGSANQVERVTTIVINEILYHPPEERAGEFIELFNLGGTPVDISGFHFNKGIDFTFPDGTIMAPGAYRVIAQDPDLLLKDYGYAGALGPYQGQLSDNGEKVRLEDRSGNLVNETRYRDGGSWPDWADGRGSSLELIDPAQDNSQAAAWEASDESEKAPWEELKFHVASYVVADSSELHLYLAKAGVCHIDDVSVRRGAGANVIPDPGFEAGTAPWVIEGTHVQSHRIVTDSHSGSACLEIIASGKGDTLVNRMEIETSPTLSAGAYDVSLWARWLRGSSLLVAHGEYTAGAYGGRPSPAVNLSGNSLSAPLRLTVPLNIGTPGGENSATRKLRETTGSGNLGPLISGVLHRPFSPSAGQGVRVTARISDSDGVSSAALFYRQDDAGGPFGSVPLLGVGDVYSGNIPGFPAGTRVVFYLEAADSLGASRRFPPTAPAKTYLYQAQGPHSGSLDAARVVLDAARASELGSRQLHSNDLLDGAFVFNDEEVYYNIGLRYRASPWGRPSLSNFRVRFPKDQLFHRGMKEINLTVHGNTPNEGAANFLISRDSGPEPARAVDYFYVQTLLNGASYGTQALVQPIDQGFMTSQYGADPLGPVLKAEGRILFTDSGTLAGWDGASFAYRTENIENYRGYFIHKMRQTADDWASFIALCKVMDRRQTPNALFDQQVDSVLDVEAFLRAFTPRILQADWDAFLYGNGHNGYMVVDPADGRWEYLGYDMNFAFNDPNGTLFPASDPDLSRMMSRPGPRRVYFRVLHEFINDGYWSAAKAGPWLDALQAATGLGTGGIKSYLTASAPHIRTAILSSTTTAFRIVTNSGADIATSDTTVTLEGEAPVQVASIAYQRGSDDLQVLAPAWSSPVRWKATFDLSERDSAFQFLGFDSVGNVLGTAQINVHTTAYGAGITVTLIAPDHAPASGGTGILLTGTGFAAGMKVFFGGVASPAVEVVTLDVAHATAPPAAFPLSAGGKVDVELVLGAGPSLRLPLAFAYDVSGGFVRGDVTSDLSIDIQDPIALLFHLFAGVPLLCLDAADFDDSGTANLTDAVLSLEYLFRSGAPPAAPFPAAGKDPTADGLECAGQ
jgi:hypothetical protein